MTVMKDVAIAKSEFQTGERAINKIQDFQVGMHDVQVGLVRLGVQLQ